MKHFAIAIALSLVASTALAQHSGGAHKMVMPDDLKWADVPSLPPGAKISATSTRDSRSPHSTSSGRT